jgi:hypothetical protein
MGVGRTLSKSYRKLNTRLHEKAPHYGRSGYLHAEAVAALMVQFDTNDVLDYGAGKCTLQAALQLPICNYDPCIPELSAPPAPADIVACIEVLEHIEPDYLEAVLADLRRLTRQALYATIATVPSTKRLADGRNAHLIVEERQWWRGRLAAAGFEEQALVLHPNGFYVTAS